MHAFHGYLKLFDGNPQLIKFHHHHIKGLQKNVIMIIVYNLNIHSDDNI